MVDTNNNRFERSTVTFAKDLAVDGYCLPSGEFRVGITGASKALGFADNWLSRVLSGNRQTLEVLISQGFTGQIVVGFVTGKTGSQPVYTISIKDFHVLMNYAASIGNKKALELMGISFAKENKKREKTESTVRDNLASTLRDAETEVICPAGRIDILTFFEVIEVKNISDWKAAIGQVLIYGEYYPNKSKRIHLFGRSNTISQQMIITHAHKFNISVSFE